MCVFDYEWSENEKRKEQGQETVQFNSSIMSVTIYRQHHTCFQRKTLNKRQVYHFAHSNIDTAKIIFINVYFHHTTSLFLLNIALEISTFPSKTNVI